MAVEELWELGRARACRRSSDVPSYRDRDRQRLKWTHETCRLCYCKDVAGPGLRDRPCPPGPSWRWLCGCARRRRPEGRRSWRSRPWSLAWTGWRRRSARKCSARQGCIGVAESRLEKHEHSEPKQRRSRGCTKKRQGLQRRRGPRAALWLEAAAAERWSSWKRPRRRSRSWRRRWARPSSGWPGRRRRS